MPSPFQNEVPSNYVALPTTPEKSGLPLAERTHDKIRADRISGWLDLQLRTLGPLHIGSGVPAMVERQGKRILARDIVLERRGRHLVPVVPGASLKGAVRSLAEALGGGCDPLARSRCQPTCRVCSIFGHLMESGGYLGRIGFGDATPEDPAAGAASIGIIDGPTAFQPRRDVGRRIYGAPKGPLGQQVPYSVVDRGVVFRTRLTLVNVERAELGLVLLACGCDGTFNLRIGGGKFAGLGKVRFEPAEAWLREGYQSPAGRRLDEAAAKMLAQEAVEAFPIEPTAKHVLEQLRAVLGER